MIGLALVLSLIASEAPAERWGCSTHRGVIEYRRANLELRVGGTFHLRHSNVSPFAGETLTMDGTWRRDGDAVLLTPTSGDRSFWRGDGHRFDHGEDVHYCQWREPLMGGERSARIQSIDGVERMDLRELGTPLFRLGGADAQPACSQVEPSPSPSPGHRCETPKRR